MGHSAMQGVALKGDKGDAPVKGVDYNDGAALTYADLTTEQKAALAGPQGEAGTAGAAGAKGDPFVYADFTSQQLIALTGPQGQQGIQGETGTTGAKGDTGAQGASGLPARSTSTQDTVNNNATLNTLADVTGLSFAVTSGTTYYFKAFIRYTSAATTTGSRWTLNGPTTSVLCYRSQYTLTATTITTNFAVAYSIPAASNASSLTAGNIAVIEGTITPSADGTVQVRFASEIANSAITAKAGSYIEHWT
jgi:hypothetical protein